MEYRKNYTRFKEYSLWEDTKQTPHDYEKKGVISYILSPVIVKTKNKVLQNILLFYDRSIVFLLKFVDKLKFFKDYHNKNR